MKFKKYKLKKNMWSLKGDYRIYDENDNELYHAKGRAFAFNPVLNFQNTAGEDLFQIRSKFLSLKPTFFLSKDNKDLVKIVKSFSFRPKIFVDYLSDQDAFYVEGNLWGNEFKFFRDGLEFAYVSKDIWRLTDEYGVAIAEGYDETLILAVVVIINMIKDKEQSGAS